MTTPCEHYFHKKCFEGLKRQKAGAASAAAAEPLKVECPNCGTVIGGVVPFDNNHWDRAESLSDVSDKKLKELVVLEAVHALRDKYAKNHSVEWQKVTFKQLDGTGHTVHLPLNYTGGEVSRFAALAFSPHPETKGAVRLVYKGSLVQDNELLSTFAASLDVPVQLYVIFQIYGS